LAVKIRDSRHFFKFECIIGPIRELPKHLLYELDHKVTTKKFRLVHVWKLGKNFRELTSIWVMAPR
jgi:hypothetical protein